jgi:uncharacterized protein (TIGR03437 family)
MRFWPAIFCLLMPSLSAQEISLELVAQGLNGPVDIQNARDGSNRLFVVEQSGRIRVILNGQLRNQPFLDIQDRIVSGGERGLLGLAFAPGYAQSGRFYVNYTGAGGHTVISMFTVTSDPDVADAGSEVVLLTINQPFANHNGGQLQFGSGGLYIGVGDGGSGGDPNNNGQSLSTLLGKILRVDVESLPGTLNIPGGNPFVGTPNARDEIWAYGLRNPWRFSFDRETNQLWIADVGQNNFEEVNRVSAPSAGVNYGWRRMEGLQCFEPNCDQAGLTLPVRVYSHSQGCSVTGGYVYRGSQFAGLRGTYIYGDYCSGRIWGINPQNQNRLLLDSSLGITSFGEDESGEVYVADGGAGRVYRILGSKPGPQLSSAGVVHAASFEPGLVAGSLASIFLSGVRDSPGISRALNIPLPLSLDGVSVTMDGAAAPILAVANVNGAEQINVQAPWTLLDEDTVAVVVTADGVSSEPVAVDVLSALPGVFLIDGELPAIQHNTDFEPVTESSPLRPGEYGVAYLTGLGEVRNLPPTGSAAATSDATTLRTVEAMLDGQAAEVVFAGLAPGFVGLYQVNFRIPEGAPDGLLDLVFRVEGRAGPAVRIPVAR